MGSWAAKTSALGTKFTNQIIPSDSNSSQIIRFNKFTMGKGGLCTGQFAYDSSYFCGNGDTDGKCPYSIYSKATMSPTFASKLKTNLWKNAKTGYLSVLHPDKWGGWTFKLKSAVSPILTFSSGGFQETRGTCNKNGGDFFIENIRELMDYGDEYFVDLNLGIIYYYVNSTTRDPRNNNTIQVEIGSKVESIFKLLGNSSEFSN